MHKRWPLLLTLALAAQIALAADAPQRSSKVPAHKPEWTNSKDADPGASSATPSRAQASATQPASSQREELQKVVVLCAKDVESPEFARAWSAYVEKYHEPDADLDRAIEDVLARASAHRQRRHSATGQLTWTAEERKQARKEAKLKAMGEDPTKAREPEEQPESEDKA